MRKYIVIAVLGVIALSVIAQTGFDRRSYVLGTQTVGKFNMWLDNSPSPHEDYDGLMWLSGLERAGDEFGKDDDSIKQREYLYGLYFGGYGVLVWPLSSDDEPEKEEVQAYLAEAIPALRMLAADSLPDSIFSEALRISRRIDLTSWANKKIPADSIALYSIATVINAYYHQPIYIEGPTGDPDLKDFGRFAEGVADGTAMALLNLYDMSAYEVGLITGRSVMAMAYEDKMNQGKAFVYDDFLAGVKATLGVAPAMMTADEIDAYIKEDINKALADTIVTDVFETSDTVYIETPEY